MAGGLIWITGLPGVGKSALAGEVVRRLRASGRAVVVLDGDTLREVLDANRHDPAARLALGLTYSRLAAWLAGQGIVVVAAVVALFHAVHAANRAGPQPLLEVWLRAPETLRRARAGDRDAAGPRVGVDLPAEWPLQPHLVLDNDDRAETLARLAEAVVAAWEGGPDVRS
jgi:adenylylsulfate kinase-like enzyme